MLEYPDTWRFIYLLSMPEKTNFILSQQLFSHLKDDEMKGVGVI